MRFNGQDYLPGTVTKGFLETEFGARIPYTLLCGTRPGKTLLVTAGIHSREYPGIEASVRLAKELLPEQLCGQVLLVHAANYSGFLEGTPNDCVPEDGRNLNRVFPGDAAGTFSQKLAARLESIFLAAADFHVDLHSGGAEEDLFPHVYCQGVASPEVLAFSKSMARHVCVAYMGGTAKDTGGIYNRAGALGIPGILIERGGRSVWAEEEAAAYVEDVKNLLRFTGILCDGTGPVEYAPRKFDPIGFQYAAAGDLWHPARRPGDLVKKGDLLGAVEPFAGSGAQKIFALDDGILLYQKSTLYAREGDFLTAVGIF